MGHAQLRHWPSGLAPLHQGGFGFAACLRLRLGPAVAGASLAPAAAGRFIPCIGLAVEIGKKIEGVDWRGEVRTEGSGVECDRTRLLPLQRQVNSRGRRRRR